MQCLDYAKIGNRIRQARKIKGWSQELFAKKCGISLSFIGHIERGTRNMSLDTFATICSVLGAGADELLFGIPHPKEYVEDDMHLQAKADDDSYIMYAKIMKSVADIINGI